MAVAVFGLLLSWSPWLLAATKSTQVKAPTTFMKSSSIEILSSEANKHDARAEQRVIGTLGTRNLRTYTLACRPWSQILPGRGVPAE
jgi:hypothetical protein